MSQIVSDHVFCTKERGQRIEQMADIYENADAVRRHETSTVTKNNDSLGKLQSQNAGGDIAKRRCHGLIAVSLVLLCVLLLVGVIVLWVMFNTQTTSVNQLQTKYNNLTVEQRWLNSSYTNLTEKRHQLQKERDELKSLLSALKNGFSYFNSSIYYISTGKKTWSESQQDCKARGADLVIINSNEEKDFIESWKRRAWVWIGLTDIAIEGIWSWVDGSALTFTYWENTEPNGKTAETCALFLGKFHDYPCNSAYGWICEKRI